jgi:Ku70/Ku80 beta-barrel domain
VDVGAGVGAGAGRLATGAAATVSASGVTGVGPSCCRRRRHSHSGPRRPARTEAHSVEWNEPSESLLVGLFTATSSQGVAFHLLHAKCGSRIQMRLECPIHGIVPRDETVKGYEIAKDEYVRFEPEELK